MCIRDRGYDNEITFMAPPFDNIVYSYDKKGALRQQIPFKIYRCV